MSDKQENEIWDNVGDLIKSATNVTSEFIKARDLAYKRYRKLEPEPHNRFRVTLDGLIGRTIMQLRHKIDSTNDKISYQISIAISFVRTHFLLNELILNGELIESYTLIRKNFESATRLNEIDKNPLQKLLKKTPNVINIFGVSGKRLYPDLSEIAHFGTPRVGELLSIDSANDGRVGPSLIPIHSEHGIECYNRHAFVSIYFVFWLIQFLKKVYPEYDSTDDDQAFMFVISAAEECNILESPST
ncbi:hypothetical protein GYB22_04430 [bacterium]|nr:hypothetical protein [bacterium]